MEVVDLSIAETALLLIAVAAASIISSVTGMAGGVLMFSAMNVFIPLRPLIAIHGAVQIFNNAARSWYLRTDLRLIMCGYFSVGAILGATITTLVIARYATELVPMMLLAGLIFYTLFKPKSMPKLKLTDRQFFWVGIATGSLGILAGAVDPLLAAFFMRDDLSKEEVVANKSMMQLVAHMTKVPAFIFLGFSFLDNLYLIVLFSIVAVVSTRFGLWLLSRINSGLFFRLMWWALCLAGVRVLYQIFQHFGVM